MPDHAPKPRPLRFVVDEIHENLLGDLERFDRWLIGALCGAGIVLALVIVYLL